MSVNTPASCSAHALRTRLGMPSRPAALRGLTRLNVLLTSAAVKESPQVLVAGRVSGTEVNIVLFLIKISTYTSGCYVSLEIISINVNTTVLKTCTVQKQWSLGISGVR